MSQEAFRQAWGKFATGVTVLTTIQPDGGVHGMTTNGVAPVSQEPLLVLACIGRNRNTHALVKEKGRFAINILAQDQQHIAECYMREPKDRKGDVDVPFRFTPQGSAIIEGYLDCRVVQAHPAGDHTIFVAEVDEIGLEQGSPLVYFEGRFGQV